MKETPMQPNAELLALLKAHEDVTAGTFLATAIICKNIAKATGTTDALNVAIEKYLELPYDPENLMVTTARERLISVQGSL